MAALREDIDTAASWIADALRSSGYPADFGPASLWAVDRFLDEQTTAGKARRGGLLAQDFGNRLFALGAYTGEVIRRGVGGDWQCDDSDPEGEVNVRLVLPDGTVLWPVQRVIKRVQNGSEDGIASYGLTAGLDVGPAPAAAKQRRFFTR